MKFNLENIEYINNFKPEIAIIAPPLDSVPSVSGNAIYTLVEYIATYSKFPILVFSIAPIEQVQNDIHNQIIYYRKPFRNSFLNRLLGYRLSKKILKSVNLKYVPYYRWAYKICKENMIEVVLQEELVDMLHFIKLKNIKVILHQHQLINQTYWNQLQHKINDIVFVSKTSKLKDNKNYLDKFSSKVIYNGIDLNIYTILDTNKKDESTHFLYVGRLHEQKGVLDLMQAFHEIENNKITLMIIGDRSYNYGNTSEFFKIFDDMIEIDNRISFIGRVQQNELPSYYIESDFVVVPSKGKEGLPKVVTESVIMGLPVIASDRGGTKELVQQEVNGVIIDNPVGSKTIKIAILKALENKSVLMKNAKEKRESFRKKLSHIEMVRQFDVLFEEKLTK